MERTIIVDGTPVLVDGELDHVNVNLTKTIRDEPPVRVKLMKMSKGYQWELSSEGPDADSVIATLKDADQKLRHQFATEVE